VVGGGCVGLGVCGSGLNIKGPWFWAFEFRTKGSGFMCLGEGDRIEAQGSRLNALRLRVGKEIAI